MRRQQVRPVHGPGPGQEPAGVRGHLDEVTEAAPGTGTCQVDPQPCARRRYRRQDPLHDLGRRAVRSGGGPHQVGGREPERPHADHVGRGGRAGVVQLLHPRGHPVGGAEQATGPRVEHRVGRCPRGAGRPAVIGGGHPGRQQQRDPVADPDAGPGRGQEAEVRRGYLSVGHRVERRGRAGEVAADQLERRIGLDRVRGGVDRVDETVHDAPERELTRIEYRFRQQCPDEARDLLPDARDAEPVDNEPPYHPGVGGRTGQRRQPPQLVDQLVEPGVMQAALQGVPEHGAQRLSLPYPLEELPDEPDAPGRKLDRERRVRLTPVAEVDVAHQRRGARLVQRRRVDEARVVGHRHERRRLAGQRVGRRAGRLRAQVGDPAVPADGEPGRVRHPQLRQAPGGERGHPRVEAVRRGVEGVAQVAFQGRGVGLGEDGQGGAQLGDLRGRGLPQPVPDGRGGTRYERVALPLPGLRGRLVRYQVHELRVGEQYFGRSGRLAEQAGGRVGVRPQQRVPQQYLQQRVEGGRYGCGQRVDVGDREQVRDVRGDTHERGTHRVGHLLVDRVVDRGRGTEPDRGADRASELRQRRPVVGYRVVAGEQEPAQVLQELLAHQAAYREPGRGGVGLQHVGQVGVRVVGRADPRYPPGRRSPGRLPQRDERGAHARERGVAGPGQPGVQGRDGQHAVRLGAGAQDRQRAGRADEVHRVGARVVAQGGGQPGTGEADHLRQEIPHGGGPQGGRHRAGERLVDEAAAVDVGGSVDPERESGQLPVAAGRRLLGPDLGGEADPVLGVRYPVRRTAGGGVVRGRTRCEERQPVGAMVGVELGGDVRGPVAEPGAGDEQQVDGARQRYRQPQRHAGVFGRDEVDHPAHAVVDRGLLVVHHDRCGEVRTDREVRHDVLAGSGGHQRVAEVRAGRPLVGQQRDRRGTRGGGRRPRVREGRLSGRFRAQVGRRQAPHDPGRTRRSDRAGEHLPGAQRGRIVDGDRPERAPVRLPGGDLVGGQRRVVRVEVDLVRVHPDA